MTVMTSAQLRKEFLEFFKVKGHTVVPSDSLVPANDPSLLFTGAGMNQFKEYFLGMKRDMKRAASCQKCFRTGDVEQVGQTAGHLTFFEMLGNFSFGDYFKKEAIVWGWEFMTARLKIPKERLWVSVYEKDEEAALIWAKEIKLPAERIVRFGPKDNFWPSNAPADGPNGPCGPCSELHYDYGRCTVGKKCPDPKKCKPGCPCGRFVEVWNLVFTQYDRQPDGSLKPLPAPNIDTGMGLERLTAVMQDKMSVFETDLFEPIVTAIETLVRPSTSSGRPEPVTVSSSNRDRTSLYAIADHARALTFLISDGVVPSNEGRGYVLRMLLRKAVRAGRALGLLEPFLYSLSSVVVKEMEEAYPELTPRRESIVQLILAEEERFQQTLEEKLPLLRQEIQAADRPSTGSGRTEPVRVRTEPVMVSLSNHDRKLSANAAARFYDTHGLSYEEIADVCKQENVAMPGKQEFEKALTALQAQSKKSHTFGAIFSKDALHDLLAGKPPTDFIGYGHELTAQAKVICLVREGRSVQQVQAPAPVEVILDRSPFYGEGGGQVGDAGILAAAEGNFRVEDTQWVGSVLVHRGELVEGWLKVGHPVTAGVDASRRRRVAQNHTATHLLHAALRKVLGNQVMQAGSLVAPDRLRLDFSYRRGLTPTMVESVESLANEWISESLPVSTAQMALEEARKSGATALFGEKYGAKVRVVSIGEVSKELCGGTHLGSSNQIGLIKLIGEGSVAAGIRRVEALTGRSALDYLNKRSEQLAEASEIIGVPPAELPERLRKISEERDNLFKAQEQMKKQALLKKAEANLSDFSIRVGSFEFLIGRLPEPMDPSAIRSFVDQVLRSRAKAVVFFFDPEGRCVSAVGPEAKEKGVSSNDLLKLAVQVAGGTGGGRAELAQGRIERGEKLPELKEKLKAYLTEKLKG